MHVLAQFLFECLGGTTRKIGRGCAARIIISSLVIQSNISIILLGRIVSKKHEQFKTRVQKSYLILRPKISKIDTLFSDQKPYPLGPHIPFKPL